jgi:hypothetical protein
MIKNILFFAFFSFIFLGQAAQNIEPEKAAFYRCQARGGGGFECPEGKKKKTEKPPKKKPTLTKRQRKEDRCKKAREHDSGGGKEYRGKGKKGNGKW